MKLKKVLIIANLFHASPRIPGIAKYLHEFGWEPIILTTPVGADINRFGAPPKYFRNYCRIIETKGYQQKKNVMVRAIKLIKRKPLDKTKLLYTFAKTVFRFFNNLYQKLYLEIICYPDGEKKWKPFAIEEGSKILQNENIDAIISSSSPVTCHLIAKKLKSMYGIPWIADLRDLWTQNHNYPYHSIRKYIEKRLEEKTFNYADALVTVSSVWADKLSTLHKKEKVFTITNGFDSEESDKNQIDSTLKFTITYTGQIYSGKQDTSKLLIALRDLLSDGIINSEDISVRFYGPENESLKKDIKKYKLTGIVKQHGVIPRELAIKKQKESQSLLIFYWSDKKEKGWYPLKLFEYLASNRPIIVTGGFGGDVVEELLNKTKAGVYCKTVKDIKEALIKFYSEYKQQGKVNNNANMNEINKYSHKKLAKNFSFVLNNLR